MQNIQIILSLVGTMIGLLVTILTIASKFVKNAKIKKALEQTVNITNSIIPYIYEAEKFASYTGEEKKAYVMTKANQFAISNNIEFNEDDISEKIEQLVTLTKQVNIKEQKNISTSQTSWL